MGRTGVRTADALGRGVRGIGDALMRVSMRQREDEQIADEKQYRASVDAENRRRYDTGRRDSLRAQGFEIMDPASNPLGKAMIQAASATGTAAPSFMVGDRDPTKSFAFEDAKAAEEYRITRAQERSQAAIRNLYSGPNVVQDYELPDEIDASVTGDAQMRAIEILRASGGDLPSAYDQIKRIPGLFGRKVHDQFNRIAGQQALSDLTADRKEPPNKQSVLGPDGKLYVFDPGAGTHTPAAGVGARAVPEDKGFAEAEASLGDLRALASNPSPASDVAFMFKFIKLLDPTSVVREGEIALMRSASGLGTRAQSALQKAQSGELLTPEQRRDFMAQAEAIIAARRESGVGAPPLAGARAPGRYRPENPFAPRGGSDLTRLDPWGGGGGR